jgi:hypothetical protein
VYFADFSSLTSEFKNSKWGGTIELKQRPGIAQGSLPTPASHFLSLFLVMKIGTVAIYIFRGLENLYIFLSCNVLVIKCMCLSAKDKT